MKLNLILLTLLISAASYAQDKKDRSGYELHFGLRSITPIATDISLKKPRKKENKYFKIELVNLRVGSSYNSNLDGNGTVFNLNASAGLELGWEKRKMLSPKFTFYRGLNFGYIANLQYNNAIFAPNANSSSSQLGHQVYVPYTFGIMMNINKNWLLSAEINPRLVYRYRTFQTNSNIVENTASLGFGFSPLSGLLMLGYRF